MPPMHGLKEFAVVFAAKLTIEALAATYLLRLATNYRLLCGQSNAGSPWLYEYEMRY
jgi:hypothetical protein